MSDKPHLNPHIAAAPVYTAGTSAEEVAAQYGVTDVVKMSSNENALGPSPKAVAAIHETVPTLNRYPRVADDLLRERLARLAGAGIAPEHIATGNGGSELLAMIVRGFIFEDGDEAILCPPTFPMYEIFVRRQGGQPVCVDLTPDFQYDVDAILNAITPRTRLIFICTPNNPTGTILTRAQADRLMAGVPDRVVVVFDEAYVDFVDLDDHVDALRYVRGGRYVIVVRTLSKSHGLAGLRVGYAVAHPELAEYLWRTRMPFHLGALALAGAMAATEDTDHVARSREMVLSGREWLYQQLTDLGLFAIPSQANFLIFRPEYDPQLVYDHLLRHGIVVRPAGFFYMPDFVRVTVGTQEQNERFITALKEVLDELAALEKAGEEVRRTQKGEVVL
ncbi:MAG: histidinol-phosphate transaminase [Anaerolineae bacterium]